MSLIPLEVKAQQPQLARRDVMSKLANALEGNQAKDGWAGVPYVRIDGETDSRDRRTACLRFKEEPAIRVALLSITAAGALLLSGTVASVTLHKLPAVLAISLYFICQETSYGHKLLVNHASVVDLCMLLGTV